MPQAVITAERKRWWLPGAIRRTWKRQIPEQWAQMPPRRRRLYYRWALQGEPGMLRILAHVLRLPRWAMRALPAGQVKQLRKALEWMEPHPDCEAPPFLQFDHRGRHYYLPKPLGENMTCIEYPLADEYYLKFVQQGDDSALLLLVATLVREEYGDMARQLRDDDPRAPLHSRAEVIQRANVLRHLPLEYQMSVLMYFAGLKAYVHRVYGPHLFEAADDDDENESAENPPEEDDPQEDAQEAADPGFGWWGVLQDVAEAGLFGTMKEVYQANFHEVCMWLVRKRIAERQMKAEMNRRKPKTNIE